MASGPPTRLRGREFCQKRGEAQFTLYSKERIYDIDSKIVDLIEGLSRRTRLIRRLNTRSSLVAHGDTSDTRH